MLIPLICHGEIKPTFLYKMQCWVLIIASDKSKHQPNCSGIGGLSGGSRMHVNELHSKSMHINQKKVWLYFVPVAMFHFPCERKTSSCQFLRCIVYFSFLKMYNSTVIALLKSQCLPLSKVCKAACLCKKGLKSLWQSRQTLNWFHSGSPRNWNFGYNAMFSCSTNDCNTYWQT